MATVDSLKINVVLDGKKADAWIKRFNKNLLGIQKVAKKNNAIFKDFLRLAGFAGFVKATHDAMELGHSLEVLSRRSGVASSKLFQIDNAARRLGVDAGKLQSSLGGIATRLNLSKIGQDQQFFTLLSKWGLPARGQTVESLLYGLANTARERARTAGVEPIAELISKEWQIPYELAETMAREGSAGLKELFETTSTISDETGSRLDSMKKSWNEFLVEMQTSFMESSSKLQPYFDAVAKFFGDIFKNYGDVAWLTIATEGLIGVAGGLKVVAGGASFLSGVLGGLAATIKGVLIALGGLGVWKSGGELGGAISDWLSGRGFWYGDKEAEARYKAVTEEMDKRIKEGLPVKNLLAGMARNAYGEEYRTYKQSKLLYGYQQGQYNYKEMLDLARKYDIYDDFLASRRSAPVIGASNQPESLFGLDLSKANARGDTSYVGGNVEQNIEVKINGQFNDPKEAGEIIGNAIVDKTSMNLWMMADGERSFA